MSAPSLSLFNYTFKANVSDYTTPIQFYDDDGNTDDRVRSVELESITGASTDFYLTLENDNVLLNIPNIHVTESEVYRKIPLRFVIGYTEYDGEDYDELDVIYEQVDVDVYALNFGDRIVDARIDYIENLASKVDTPVSIVVHGTAMTDGMNIKLVNGDAEYIVKNEDIVYTIGEGGVGTAEFTLFPGMLAMNDDGTEPCAQYSIFFSYGDHNYGNGFSIIRYKYDSVNDELQKYSTEAVTREKQCYTTGEMSHVYDTVDENGNPVSNPSADPNTGDTIFIRMGKYQSDVLIDYPVDRYGLKCGDTTYKSGDVVKLSNQINEHHNGYWIVKPSDWIHVYNCEDYFYTMVRVKYNKNLTHKNGLLKLNGIQLRQGDVVWLAHQIVESENGLWVVDQGNWYGYNPYVLPDEHEELVCPADCHSDPVPYPVDGSVLVDLGVKASYPVDYVCRTNIQYKCGSRTICNYNVVPGNVVALLNQENGEDGVYLVKCNEWEKLSDVLESDVNGTTVDMTSSVVVQNNIDFCKCGGVYYIDYYFLNPSCYLHHLRRTVKIMCNCSSIAPNAAENQFAISEYVVTVGEDDSLVGNRESTPGDPVKETCTVANDDFDYDFGLTLIEHRQYVKEPSCIPSPLCTAICDIPRIYNLSMTSSYTNSNDSNGFTIKFWRREYNGWHLYAYVGSGTQNSGMDYYVYHLHVKGKATETLVDVNEHDWFSVTTGVIASDDGSESFGICDDTWEFPIDRTDPSKGCTHELDSTTLYNRWRISCTTNLLAHCSDYDHKPRKTCEDMKVGSETIQAIGDMCDICEGTGIDGGNVCETCNGTGRNPFGYLQGMSHLFGVSYYTTTMSKSQFVAEYNQYDPSCIWLDIYDVLVTDEDSDTCHTPIETDASSDDVHELLRR